MFGEMKTGAYVSGAGHVALFLWLIIGGFFIARDDFEAISVTDVSIISAEEFQALQPSGPETGDAPPAIEAPNQDEPTPTPAPAPAPAPRPAPAPAPEPAPEPDVQPDVAPAPVIEDTPQPEGDPGAAELAPDAPPAVPEEADIIAQEVTEAPEPEVEIADTAQSEVAPDETAEPTSEPQEAQEATAPEETTTQIVTEADETSNSAPTISTRPGRKPTPPPAAPAQTEVAETEEPATPGLEDLINEAVTEANEPVEDNANPGGGTGTPVTRAEKGAFILAIQRCWNVGALSTDALKVTVTVGFTMTTDAKPENNSIQLINAEGGTGAAVDRAYETARRAIIRCGSAGFGLPADKYDQWRAVEVRFNATTKEIR